VVDILTRLREPPFGTETSERNLMISAADEIERLRDALQAMRGMFDTPIARRKHGGEYATKARRLAREAMYLPITLDKEASNE
jgi:hypothetical protein